MSYLVDEMADMRTNYSLIIGTTDTNSGNRFHSLERLTRPERTVVNDDDERTRSELLGALRNLKLDGLPLHEFNRLTKKCAGEFTHSSLMFYTCTEAEFEQLKAKAQVSTLPGGGQRSSASASQEVEIQYNQVGWTPNFPDDRQAEYYHTLTQKDKDHIARDKRLGHTRPPVPPPDLVPLDSDVLSQLAGLNIQPGYPGMAVSAESAGEGDPGYMAQLQSAVVGVDPEPFEDPDETS